MNDPNVFQRVREYLDEREREIKERQTCHLDEVRRLARLCRTLSDCVSMRLAFHEAKVKLQDEFK